MAKLGRLGDMNLLFLPSGCGVSERAGKDMDPQARPGFRQWKKHWKGLWDETDLGISCAGDRGSRARPGSMSRARTL